MIFKGKGYWKGCFNRYTINCVVRCVPSALYLLCVTNTCETACCRGLTADVKRLIEFDISRWRISKSQIPPLLYIVPPDQSLPPQQPNPNSNSHPGSDPARGLQEAPSHPTVPTSEGNPGWDFHPPLDNLTQDGNWFLLSDGIGSQTPDDLCMHIAPLPWGKKARCCLCIRF